jgi:protein gp37
LSTITKIEWTDSSWNPATGCTRISSGCRNCYAYRMAERLKAIGNPRYSNGFRITLHWDLIEAPYEWKKPRKIFVNSMSDLFHDDIPISFIQDVFETMNNTPWHTYQILTKRSGRLIQLAPLLNWTPNIWQGVSIENRDVIYRLEHLAVVPAHVRFLSLEPLLGPLPKLRLDKIHWVIVGGESGPGARPMKPEWVQEIRDNCIQSNVPFFFKQWGGTQKHLNGRELDGQTWDQYPDDVFENVLAYSQV